MPSGVSQGSPPLAGCAVFSNAIFAKLGMRLILTVSFVIAGTFGEKTAFRAFARYVGTSSIS
jgi:hypothetical protein